MCEDPEDIPLSDPPAEPPSRKPWADAKPIPAMSATVPNKSSFLIFVRIFLVPSLVCMSATAKPRHRENLCARGYVPLLSAI
jgi:hypothetical protein